MKKINYLLHNVTIINFMLIARLALRYRFVTALGTLIFFCLVPYLYFSQPVVFQKEVHFKVLSQASLSPDKNATETTQNVASALNMPEILGAINSYSFTTRISERLADLSEFKELNFEHPLLNASSAAPLAQCKDKLCRVTVLRHLVPHLYSINVDQATGKFTLKVSTRSDKTTMQVLKSFQSTLQEVRIQNAKEMTERQLVQLQEMVTKSKTDIEAKGGFEKMASGEFLDALISQHKDKIKNLSARLIKDDSQFFTQRMKLQESNLAAETSIGGMEKLGYENYVKINRRIEEIRQNIASINSTPLEARTQSDSMVLSELKKELSENEAELKRMGQIKRNLALDDRFLDTQMGNKSSLEYDFKISSAQVKKLRDQYELAKAELDKLYSKKANLENELVALKPDLEYLKLLEAKLVSFKFKQSSISSDVLFENYGSDVASFKRNSIVKIFAFAFLIILFFMFSLYMVLYLFDDRIFEEQEMQTCIEELPVLGYAPHYE